MAEPRSVRAVVLGVRFVVPTVPMRVSTPINPTRSTMADDANALPTEPTSICGCEKRKRN